MEKSVLLKKLKEEISEDEYKKLSVQDISHISEHNRKTILEMMECTEAAGGEISEERVETLKRILEDYLSIYLADRREDWKWIIISCLYLCFICSRPLHAQEAVHYTTTVRNNQTVYHCPLRSEEADTACSFCICEPLVHDNIR